MTLEVNELNCPKCGEKAIEEDDNIENWGGSGADIMEWCVGHCTKCGQPVSFVRTYSYIGICNLKEERE